MSGNKTGNRWHPYNRPTTDSNSIEESSSVQYLELQLQLMREQVQALQEYRAINYEAYLYQRDLQNQAHQQFLERAASGHLTQQQALQQQLVLPYYPFQAQAVYQGNIPGMSVTPYTPDFMIRQPEYQLPPKGFKAPSVARVQNALPKVQKVVLLEKNPPIAMEETSAQGIKHFARLLKNATAAGAVDLDAVRSCVEDINKILIEGVQTIEEDKKDFRSAYVNLLVVICNNIMHNANSRNASLQEITKKFDFEALFSNILSVFDCPTYNQSDNQILVTLLSTIGELQEIELPYVQNSKIDNFINSSIKQIIDMLKTNSKNVKFIINVILGVSKIDAKCIDTQDVNELFKLSIVMLEKYCTHSYLHSRSSIKNIKGLLTAIIKLKSKWEVSADEEIKYFLQGVIKYDVLETQLNEKYSVSVQDIINSMKNLQAVMKFDDTCLNSKISDWIVKLQIQVTEYKQSCYKVAEERLVDSNVSETDFLDGDPEGRFDPHLSGVVEIARDDS